MITIGVGILCHGVRQVEYFHNILFHITENYSSRIRLQQLILSLSTLYSTVLEIATKFL